MMVSAKTMLGYAIQARDGMIGSVADLLFDDRTWTIRWLVIDTGTFLPGRKILIHPSAVGQAVHDQEELLVSLTRAQIIGSPPLASDQPVSALIQAHLNDYYGWDPHWGVQSFGHGAIASPLSPPPLYDSALPDEALDDRVTEAAGDTTRHVMGDVTGHVPGDASGGDPHLCSAADTFGVSIQARDGAIGHASDFQLNDRTWSIRYLVVETGSWWRGAQVLVSPTAVTRFDWEGSQIDVKLSQEQLRASPPWQPGGVIEPAYEDSLREHYGWASDGDEPGQE